MAEKTWRLRTADGSEFGPVSMSQVIHWAREGRLAPDTSVSSDDGRAWKVAPLFPELGMEWIVEFGVGRYYGPLRREAIDALKANGQIDANARLFRKAEDGGAAAGDLNLRLQELAERNDMLAAALAEAQQNEAAMRVMMAEVETDSGSEKTRTDDLRRRLDEAEALNQKLGESLAMAGQREDFLRAELKKARNEAEAARKSGGSAKGGLFSGKSSAELAKLEEAAKRELWMMKMRKAGDGKSLRYASRGAIDVKP